MSWEWAGCNLGSLSVSFCQQGSHSRPSVRKIRQLKLPWAKWVVSGKKLESILFQESLSHRCKNVKSPDLKTMDENGSFCLGISRILANICSWLYINWQITNLKGLLGSMIALIIKFLLWNCNCFHICNTTVCSVAQSFLTLCGCMDCSLPGSSVHGISQARVLEWVAISFSRWNQCLLHWQVDALPLCHLGSHGKFGYEVTKHNFISFY